MVQFDPLLRLPTSEELPDSDDTPVDNEFQNLIPNLLLAVLALVWHQRQDWFLGVDMGIYYLYEQVRQPVIVPDGFLSLAVQRRKGDRGRLSYVLWEENNIPPVLALEVVSQTAGGEYHEKMTKYAQLGVLYYVIYNPDYWRRDKHDSFEVYRLVEGEYVRQPPLTPPDQGGELGQVALSDQGGELGQVALPDQGGELGQVALPDQGGELGQVALSDQGGELGQVALPDQGGELGQVALPSQGGELGGVVWMPEVGLGIGRAIGTHEGWTREWLYWYDEQGNRLLTPEESLERAQLQLEQERQQTEQAQLQLEQERQQAKQKQRDAIAQLSSLGLSVEQIAEALGLSVREVMQAMNG